MFILIDQTYLPTDLGIMFSTTPRVLYSVIGNLQHDLYRFFLQAANIQSQSRGCQVND